MKETSRSLYTKYHKRGIILTVTRMQLAQIDSFNYTIERADRDIDLRKRIRTGRHVASIANGPLKCAR